MALLAERAFIGPVAGIVRNILGGEDGFYLYSVHFGDGAENSRNARYFSAVEEDAVITVFQRFPGGCSSHQDKNIFLFKHRFIIIAEYNLAADDFRFDNINRLMGIQIGRASCRERV